MSGFVCRTCGGNDFHSTISQQGTWTYQIHLSQDEDGDLDYSTGEGEWDTDDLQPDEVFECGGCGASSDTLAELVRKTTGPITPGVAS
jgi:hypothetical protein